MRWILAVAARRSLSPRQMRAGRIQGIASLTATRLPQLPNIPSISELGWPGQVFHGGLFVFAPAALKEAASSLNSWIGAALRSPEVIAKYQQFGIETTPLNLQQVRESVAEGNLLFKMAIK